MGQTLVARVFAEEWPIVVAALVRDLGDLDLAEDAAQEAFAEAAARWGSGETPDKPGAWLITTARRKAIDRIRRDRRFADRLPLLHQAAAQEPPRPSELVDDQLAVIFGCCHPALAEEARVALTLREVVGLSTAQIAHSFLVSEATMAKRLVRAKAKIRAANVPFEIPGREHMDVRLGAVLHIVYLIFTEGHTAADSADLIRGDLCDEARWLAGVLVDLLRGEAEVLGLASLLAFSDSRRRARTDEHGDLVLLEHQDRSLWDHGAIDEGTTLLRQALAMSQVGRYQVQAAVAEVHATAATAKDTDWSAIVGLYDLLANIDPSPVVALNRAVAVAMADGPEAGLSVLDDLASDDRLAGFHYFHAARADLLRRLDRSEEAAAAYDEALGLVTNEAERSFLEHRRQDVT